MKKLMRSFLGLGVLAILATACDKNNKTEDTVKPVIHSVSLNGEDHDIVAAAGSTLQIEAEVSDNEELGELKMDVHDVFDGHGHKKSFVRWADVKTVQLSGKEQTVQESMNIPQGVAAGPYHMVIRLLDASGNESDFVEMEFMITNGSEPVINITSPDFSQEVDAPRGSILSMYGTITDDVDLEEIIIRLEEEHEEGDSHKSTMDEPLYEVQFELTGSSDTSWDFQSDGNVNIAIPATAEEGHYHLEVIAIDSEGNMNIFEAEVHVM